MSIPPIGSYDALVFVQHNHELISQIREKIKIKNYNAVDMILTKLFGLPHFKEDLLSQQPFNGILEELIDNQADPDRFEKVELFAALLEVHQFHNPVSEIYQAACLLELFKVEKKQGFILSRPLNEIQCLLETYQKEGAQERINFLSKLKDYIEKH